MLTDIDMVSVSISNQYCLITDCLLRSLVVRPTFFLRGVMGSFLRTALLDGDTTLVFVMRLDELNEVFYSAATVGPCLGKRSPTALEP